MDHFVLADTFRYRSETFQNRSKLRNAQGGHWITIPLFGRPDGAPIRRVDIETGGRWQEKHWRSFFYDYRSTMYFEYYEEEFRPFFDEPWENLARCVCRSIELQTDLFAIDTPITRASALEGAPETVAGVVDALGADALVLPADQPRPDGLAASVHLFHYDHPTYHQNFGGFEPGVTALDLLFNYGREAPRRMAQGITTPTPP